MRTLLFLGAALAGAVGCQQLLGIEEGTPRDPAVGGATATGTGGSPGTGGVGGTAGVGAVGAVGVGGGGGGAGGVVVPDWPLTDWTSSLTAVYLFDSASSLYEDASGGHTLTPSNNPGVAMPGFQGTAHAAIGENSGFRRDLAAPFNNTGSSFSLGGWFKVSTATPGTHVVARRTASGDGFALLFDATEERAVCFAGDTAGQFAEAKTAFGSWTVGPWTHVACVFDSVEIRAYIVGADGTTSGDAVTHPPVATFELGIGIDGYVDEFFFHDKPLSVASINRIRHCRISGELCMCAGDTADWNDCADGNCTTLGACNRSAAD